MKTISEMNEVTDTEESERSHCGFSLKVFAPANTDFTSSSICFCKGRFLTITLKNKSGIYYKCQFSCSALSERLLKQVDDLVLFSGNEGTAFHLSLLQEKELSTIFDKIKHELSSSYCYKEHLLKTYFWEILHYAMKHLKKERSNFFV